MIEAPPRRDGRAALTTAAVATLLALFWWQAVSAALHESPTSDELPHITAGYAFDRFGDFRMQPENGVLPQRLFGLPSVADGARLPLDPALWRQSTYWQVAWDFFYGNNNLTDWIVLRARALNALFGVALGGFIFFVARRWYGRAGALLALGFYVFAPNFLAHAGFATSDLAAAFCLPLASWLFWRHLERRDAASGALAALGSGLALTAKFNGILIAPIYLLLIVADAASAPGAAGRRLRRFATGGGLAAIQAVAAGGFVWLCFNLRFSPRGPGTPEFERFAWAWSEMLAPLGWKRTVLEAAVRAHLLPEAWLYGLTNVLAGEIGRPEFLAGEHASRGWWLFFPVLFLVKTPLPTLGALALAAFVAARRLQHETWRRIAPIAIPALVFWAFALVSRINIGDRHILPVYPALFIALGGLARHRIAFGLGAALALANAAVSTGVRPHYLAAFNSLAGGPAHAYRIAADSSLDWGQDLPALREWIEANRRPGEKIYLGYFGSAWPPAYGVRPNYFLPSQTYLVRPPLAPYAFEAGLYCVSATILDEIYSPYPGPWRAEWERAYRAGQGAPDRFEEFDRLRFARLCKFLQQRKPDGFAGYSILIFRLDAGELRQVLDGPVTTTHRMREP